MTKQKSDAVRVMIVDDHAVVREGLRNFLGMLPGIELVAEAASGTEALERAPKAKPQVVLMDLMMPVMDGIEATRRLHEAHPEVKVIVLTSFADDDRVFPALRAGAVAYLLKDVGPKELAEAIVAAARGEVRLHPDVTKRLVSELAGGAPKRPEEELTGREREVLQLVAEGHPNKQIAAMLGIAVRTVEAHRANIMRKLNLADHASLVRYAVRRGIVGLEE